MLCMEANVLAVRNKIKTASSSHQPSCQLEDKPILVRLSCENGPFPIKYIRIPFNHIHLRTPENMAIELLEFARGHGFSMRTLRSKDCQRIGQKIFSNSKWYGYVLSHVPNDISLFPWSRRSSTSSRGLCWRRFQK